MTTKQSMAVFLSLFTAILFSQPVLANIEEKREHLDTLRQAATELQSTNKGLADKLNATADKKEEWLKEKEDKKMKKTQSLQEIRQAAKELQTTNADLGDRLNDIADQWEKKLNEKYDDKMPMDKD